MWYLVYFFMGEGMWVWGVVVVEYGLYGGYVVSIWSLVMICCWKVRNDISCDSVMILFVDYLVLSRCFRLLFEVL